MTRMFLWPMTLAAVALAGTFPAPPTLATQAPESKSALEADPAGWRDVMPGAELAGWTRLPLPPSAPLGKQQWRVDPQAKILICEGDGGHDWLRYDRELGDAIFHVEWRFTPVEGKTGYNSGVYLRNAKDAALWHQAQVGSGSGGFLFGDTLVNGERKRVNLRPQLKEQRVRPAGEWNTYELTARGPRLSVWVNGAVVSDFPDCRVPRGFAGVEGEGWRIEFRNMKIKELGSQAPAAGPTATR